MQRLLTRMVLGLAALAMLAACAQRTGPSVGDLDNWIGQSETAFVATWGAPDQVVEAGGARFLRYVDRQMYVAPGFPRPYGHRPLAYDPDGFGPYALPYAGGQRLVTRECIITFRFDDGLATSWRAEGNACRL